MKSNGDYLPEIFDICYFERGTGFNCLCIDGPEIIHDFADNKERVTPSPEEWELFWDKVEELGVWDWQGDYEKCCMVDGYRWRVTMTLGSRQVHTTGMNDAPTHITGSGVTSALEILLDALEDLTGFRLDEGS